MAQQTDQQRESLEQRGTQPALVRVETQPGVSADTPQALIARPREGQRASAWQKWFLRLAVLLVIALLIGFFVWRRQRASLVTLIQPQRTTITETIASSGRVGGATETLVGAQATGLVEQLFVQEGDRVVTGQRLAVLKNNVAEAQMAQAEQAVQTARAQLAQTARGPLRSEVEAAAQQVRQAQAQVNQRQS